MSLPRRALALLALPALARAQAFPTRPIRMIVGFPPGGGSDLVARPIAQRMSEVLGQQVVVENRGGANGTLGLGELARRPADGYPIGPGNAAVIAINPLLYRRLHFNLAKSQIDAGRVRAIAFIGGTERHPHFPDVPTTTEQGMPQFVMRGWQGFIGRAGTPEPVLDALENALRVSVDDPGVATLFASQGILPRYAGRAAMGQAITSQQAVWRPVIAELGLRLD